jgi:hypothetical protein
MGDGMMPECEWDDIVEKNRTETWHGNPKGKQPE